jgi:site-specific recombinase XerD
MQGGYVNASQRKPSYFRHAVAAEFVPDGADSRSRQSMGFRSTTLMSRHLVVANTRLSRRESVHVRDNV